MTKSFFAVLGLAIGLTGSVRADLTYFSLAKGRSFTQMAGESPAPAALMPYFFRAKVEGTAITPLNVQVNGAVNFGIPIQPSTYLSRHESESALDTAHPAGNYVLTFFFNGRMVYATNALAAGTFPEAPEITNLAEAQAIDPTNDFTFTWNAFNGGTTNDLIVFWLMNSSGKAFQTASVPGSLTALNGTATSVRIPAGKLAPGHAYAGRLTFVTVQSMVTNQYPKATNADFYQSETSFTVKTLGNGDSTPPAIVTTFPAQGATDVPTNMPVVITFSEPMKKQDWISWTGGQANTVWNDDATMFVLSPSVNFPSNRVITITLGDSTSIPFADTNGNPLPPETLLTFTTGSTRYQPQAPQLSSQQIDATGMFAMDVAGETNRGVAIQASSNLMDWVSYPAQTMFNGTVHFTEPTIGGAARFYRVLAY
jgi:hypothetical protein